MRQEDRLKEKAGTKLPYTVPEGYFKSFKERLAENLPEYPQKPAPQKLTLWQRMRPYVYLAAMFAGIWCMMQIFHRVSTAGTDNGTPAMAVTTTQPDIYDYDAEDFYLDGSSGQDLVLQDEVMTLYPNMDELKRDFYAQL